jgi:hypothetical protein
MEVSLPWNNKNTKTPHYWPVVGFIDTKLSRRIAPLMIEFENKAQAAGFSLD